MRCIIVFLVGVLGAQTATSEIEATETTETRPIVGAIRWDAWHGDASEVGLIVEQTLAPEHWPMMFELCYLLFLIRVEKWYLESAEFLWYKHIDQEIG